MQLLALMQIEIDVTHIVYVHLCTFAEYVHQDKMQSSMPTVLHTVLLSNSLSGLGNTLVAFEEIAHASGIHINVNRAQIMGVMTCNWKLDLVSNICA